MAFRDYCGEALSYIRCCFGESQLDSSRPRGFSVKVFMPSGQPEGLRIIEKSNWTGQCILFPRSNWEESQEREELKRTGVYILWDLGEYENSPLVYIGESDQIDKRLKSHEAKKDFWTHAVACVSKDQNLNNAHALYIERRLFELAKEAKRCQLLNGNTPPSSALSEADIVDAELYLSDLLLCLPIVGLNIFAKPSGKNEASELLYIKAQGITAQGYEQAGKFVVLAESEARIEEQSSIPKGCRLLREQLVQEGILVQAGNTERYHMTQDHIFSSPSRAASVILGVAANGRKEWVDQSGRTLYEIQGAIPQDDDNLT